MSVKKICDLADKFEKLAADERLGGGDRGSGSHPLDGVEDRIKGAIKLAIEIAKLSTTKTEEEVPRRMLGLLSQKVAEDLEKALLKLADYEEHNI